MLLDEVEQLNDPDFNAKLQGLLRSVAQEPTMALCVATRHQLEQVFPPPAAGGTSPFHNIFTCKRIGPFSADECRDFLATRLAGRRVQFTAQEIERLVTESTGHPAVLQQRAKALFEEKRV